MRDLEHNPVKTVMTSTLMTLKTRKRTNSHCSSINELHKQAEIKQSDGNLEDDNSMSTTEGSKSLEDNEKNQDMLKQSKIC